MSKVKQAETEIAETGVAEPKTEKAIATAFSNAAPPAQYSEEGSVLKNVLTARDMISKAEVLKMVSLMQPGEGAWVARVIGMCTGTFVKENTLPDGKKIESIGLSGSFEIQRSDGTSAQGNKIYMPGSAFGEGLHTLFQTSSNVHAVEVDCDIGVSATGKAIPFEYVVRTHIKHDLQADLRGRRAPVFGTIAPLQPSLPSLEAPKS